MTSKMKMKQMIQAIEGGKTIIFVDPLAEFKYLSSRNAQRSADLKISEEDKNKTWRFPSIDNKLSKLK